MPRYPSGVIDLRILRAEPETVRASQRLRGDDEVERLGDAIIAEAMELPL